MRAAQCIPLADCRSPDQPSPAKTVAPGQVDTVKVDDQVQEQPPSTPYFLRLPRNGDFTAGRMSPASRAVSPAGLRTVSRLSAYVSGISRGERQLSRRPGVDPFRGSGVSLQRSGSGRGAAASDGDSSGGRKARAGNRAVAQQLHGGAPLYRYPHPRGSGHYLGDGWAGAASRLGPAEVAQRFRFTREDERESFVFEVQTAAELVNGGCRVPSCRGGHGWNPYDVGVFTDRLSPYPASFIYSSGYGHGSESSSAAAQGRSGGLCPRRRGPGPRSSGQRRRYRSCCLSEETLERGNLDQFTAIIVGPRAYETDSALVENNARLLNYARRGGLVIVQYQQHRYFEGHFAPFPLTVGGQPLVLDGTESRPGTGTARSRPSPPVSHDRVTDENAPVRIVAPKDPAVRTPNLLTSEDWRGWIQERGLYFARSWDKRYRPILETHDPGEAPLTGGLLIAPLGKGTYVYTGLSFFRQLPAAVPGAFRLFANLLALPHGR